MGEEKGWSTIFGFGARTGATGSRGRGARDRARCTGRDCARPGGGQHGGGAR
jgi:hypothetical protein